MKLLYLTPRYPHIVDGGGLLKTKKIINYFKDFFDLRVVSLNTDIQETMNSGFIYEYPLNKKKTKPNLINLFKSYVYNEPLSIVRNSSNSLYLSMPTHLEWADIIVVDHFLMYQYIPNDCKKKIYLHQHNAEYKIWQGSVKTETNIIKSILLRFESRRIRKYEYKICNRSALVFAAPNDRVALQEIGLDSCLFKNTYHLGDDSLISKPLVDYSKVNNQLVFIGNMEWGPNIDGLIWFLDEIWNLIIEEKPDAILNIIGKLSEEKREKLNKYSNLKIFGFIDDLDDVLCQCKVFIAPLRYGSGMKVKNITALYRGMPIVTTSIGAEGINISHGINGMVVDDENEFANSILTLLGNDDVCQKLSYNARKLAISKYSWNENLKLMVDEIISNA